MLIEAAIQEPLTEFTAALVVDIYDGTITVNQWLIAVLGRPDIVDGGRENIFHDPVTMTRYAPGE